MRPVVGVTGGVGCGKSEVGRILEQMGVSVLDADRVVHRLLRENAEVQQAVVALCGPDVRAADGGLSRRAIADRVFADDAMRNELERILHPLVRAETLAWRENAGKRLGGAALIPLLFEAGFADGWDSIWCVVAREDIVDARLAAKGWPRARIDALRNAQWPIEKKAAAADIVIENNGTLEELTARVQERWRLQERRST